MAQQQTAENTPTFKVSLCSAIIADITENFLTCDDQCMNIAEKNDEIMSL